jgi:DedD protein
VIPEPPDFDAGYDASVAPPEGEIGMPLPQPEGPTETSEPPPLPAPPPPDAAPAPATRAEPPAERPAPAAPPPARGAPVAGPKPVPPGTRSWVVQVASLGSPEAARGLQDELRGKGYPAFVEQARVGGKLYYRVRVGPEVDRARADGIARRLANETGADPLVQRYP